jgi:hypothetical protein
MEARKLLKSEPASFQLSLRIRHPSVDPVVLSGEFRVDPEHAFRAGAPRPSRGGLAPAAFYSESYWLAILNPAAWVADPCFAEQPGLRCAQMCMGRTLSERL